MSQNPNLPIIGTAIAFTTAPNSTTTPTWVDVSDRVEQFTTRQGRMNELAQTEAGEADFTMRNDDEALSPANTSGPYYGNLLPYRAIQQVCAWPTTGNVLNDLNAAWSVPVNGNDGNFETSVGHWAAYGTTPILATSTAQHWQGTHSLLVTCTTSASIQGAQLAVPTIPGQQVTVSGYVLNPSSGGVAGVEVFPVGIGSPVTTSTKGAFTRLAVTFTATTNTTTVVFASTAGPTAGQVFYLDGAQVEYASTASAYSGTGPQMFGQFAGYVERWPTQWRHNGYFGEAKLVAVDAIGTLGQTIIGQGAYAASVQADVRSGNGASGSFVPSYYPCGDGTMYVIGQEGLSASPALGEFYAFGFLQSYFENLAGEWNPNVMPTGLDPVLSNVLNPPGSNSGGGYYALLDTATGTLGGVQGTWGFESLIRSAAPGGTFGVLFEIAHSNLSNQQMVCLRSDGLQVVTPAGVSTVTTWTSGALTSALHHLYVRQYVSGANIVTEGYIDGVLQATFSYTSTTGTATPVYDTVILGQYIAPTSSQSPYQYLQSYAPFQTTTTGVGGLPVAVDNTSGYYAQIVFWPAVNSTLHTSILDRGANGPGAWAGENSAARFTRTAGWANFQGAVVAPTGSALMAAAAGLIGTDAKTALGNVATSEMGGFNVSRGGALTFVPRTARWNETASTWTFGEDTAGGEMPYQGDIQFDYDPQHIYNSFTVARNMGITAAVQDVTSQRDFFARAASETIYTDADADATNIANWLLGHYKDPALRVQQITLDPASNPALWPCVLGVAIGQRVTVNRRTSAGLQTGDFFVEQMQNTGNLNGPSWTCTLQLSPAAYSAAWVIGTSALGTTTFLAF